MLSSVWQYVSGALGAMLLMLGIYTYMTVNGLKLELADTQTDVVVAKADYNMCRASVDEQNGKIEKLGVDYDGAVKKLSEWKKKPAEIRYNTIYKYISREVVNNEESCENTKRAIDAIRHIDFSGL